MTILFSEPVEAASAEMTGNYLIDNAITVTSAILQPDQTTVSLTTSNLAESVLYTITVNNVVDRAETPNIILTNSTVEFQYSGNPDLVGWYRFDADNNGLIVDHSGNGNDGVCIVSNTCPTFVGNDGQPAGAYDFAGNGEIGRTSVGTPSLLSIPARTSADASSSNTATCVKSSAI